MIGELTSATSADAGAIRTVGAGLLAEAIDRAIGTVTSAPEVTPGRPELFVVASDSWWVGDHPETVGDVPTLPVRVEIGQAVVGPVHVPGLPGCPTCLELRRRRAREFPERADALWEQHGDDLSATPSRWLTGLAVSTVATLVADECARIVGHRVDLTPRSANAALFVDLTKLAVRRHAFIPDPCCPRCGELPPDTRERARIELVSRPKPTPTTYRVRDIADSAEHLLRTYVDPECGMISSLVSGTYGGVAASIASLRCRPHDASEPGFGGACTVRDSRLTAVLEALERFAGAAPGGRASSLVASHAELGDTAVDPRAFGLHSPDAYEQPGFRCQRFEPDRRTRWVWGYSFARAEPVLVPEGAAFWHTHPETALRPFFFEISNGCALGTSVEEAALHGLLEVIERDAFLMTWYASVPGRRIELDTAAPRIRTLAATIASSTGYDVLAFDTTMEHGVPSVWVMAVHPDDAHDVPKVLCTACAHLDPGKALSSALNELGPALEGLRNSFPQDADRAREMLTDPTRVRTMNDHSVLYGAYEAFERLDFLTRSGESRSVDDMVRAVGDSWHSDDLTDDLRRLVDRVVACGMDVIVVDQTIPEHRLAGLSCVKVLASGSLSMTFGHQHRRTDGIARLAERVAHGGNPFPHPFP